MKSILVCGGRPLFGDVRVSGSKNAALPILFSCLITKGVSVIDNLPDIGDVRVTLQILSELGAQISRDGDRVTVDTENLEYDMPREALVSEIRASTYLIGSCLSRFGVCHLQPFGGCGFSKRPIDMHIDACLALGGELSDGKITAKGLRGGRISFRLPSVGATVNAILLAAGAVGDSFISGCAVEPHIDALIEFLNSCGASITRCGRELYIQGRELHGGKTKIIGDMIEAGSYIAAGLITHGKVRVLNCPTDHMAQTIEELRCLGAEVIADESSLSAQMHCDGNYLSVNATPYPGFPTDLQPIFAPLLAEFSGGEIKDDVWQGRFGYLNELSHFGVESNLINNIAYIRKSRLRSGVATAPDLRGGAACLLAALSAEGQSRIFSPEIILRGYENLENKLCALGAQVRIID